MAAIDDGLVWFIGLKVDKFTGFDGNNLITMDKRGILIRVEEHERRGLLMEAISIAAISDGINVGVGRTGHGFDVEGDVIDIPNTKATTEIIRCILGKTLHHMRWDHTGSPALGSQRIGRETVCGSKDLLDFLIRHETLDFPGDSSLGSGHL